MSHTTINGNSSLSTKKPGTSKLRIRSMVGQELVTTQSMERPPITIMTVNRYRNMGMAIPPSMALTACCGACIKATRVSTTSQPE
ncbi:hypothetical protein D3C75_1283230 [compost metagenome]